MKRFLALLALVLGVVSCQTEPEGLDVNVGEVDAIINVTIPEAETRAGGSNSALGVFDNGVLGTKDDNTTMRYILQVYYNGEASQERKVAYSDGKSVAFEVRLVPERNYQFVVWADVVTDGKNDTDNHYDTSDLENITLKGEWNAMDESRDAFTATELIENYSGASNINITLKRPFAKLRVVTTDIKNLTNLGIVPTTATVEYTTTHRVAFNAFEGKAADASESKTHSYTINPYSNETNTGAEYTLFTDYFFAENDVVKFNFKVYEDEAKTKLIKENNFVTDINVKRNHLTTIKGNILTDGKGVKVEIEDGFENGGGTNPDYEYATITSAVELLRAIGTSGNYIIMNDISVTEADLLVASTLAATRSTTTTTTTINLNGFTITFEDGAKVEVPENHTLIIKDESENQEGKIETGNDAGIENKGNVTIEGGNIDEGAIENNGGDVEIKGGNLEVGAVENIVGDVIITGKDIDDNVVTGDVTNYYAGLVQAFADGGEYTLGANIALEQPLALAQGKELKLTINEGVVLSIVDTATNKNFELIKNQGTLTIEGEGKITVEATNNRGWNNYSAVIANTVGGTLTVKGVTLEHLGGTDMAYGIDNLTNGKGTVAVTTIDGATVKSPYRAVRQFLNGVEATNELYVKAGTKLEGGNKSIFFHDPSAKANTGKLVVEEGAELYGGVYLFVTEGSTEWPVKVSVAASAIKSGEVTYKNAPEGYKVVEENGVWTVVNDVAKIGEVRYTSLAKAVAAVKDGETITLVADEVFTENNYYDNGGWKDGLGYSGDKSFTIDLNSKTIRQDGALNDYLIWIKNDGSKANTITLKNGTLDAGTTAYCALATASSNKQKITINLEDINLVGNNSNGAVAKIRGGAEMNVKSGTVITGKNNYVGIEAVGNNTVVNIYDNVNIYQNGTESYVGAIVGASYNATMNIYGGYGKSAKCGIIVMSTGATINVSGGEWIANNDGSVANDNKAVLVSQNNRNETGWACKSILNVTGGTFKGGYNCYGVGPGVEPDDAQINIKGGNFNSNPETYVVAGYESVEENGVWTVGKSQALADFEAAIAKGGEVTLAADITLLESVVIEGKKVVLDLNGKTVNAPLFSAFEVKSGAELTIKNGKVVAYESTVRAIGGKAIIESGEYTSTGTAVDSPSTYRYSLDCREGGELVVNGGTFKSNNGMINVSSTVTINGGKFENVVEKATTRHFAYVSASITINDGEFYGKANSSAGGCFFCGAAETCNIQVNGGKFTSLWTSGSVNRIFESYYGGTIDVTGGMFNTNGGIATFVTENTDEATKAAYPYKAK